MESFAAIDLHDYWNEVKDLTVRRLSEEDCRSHDDEFDSSETFLQEIGLHLPKNGKDIPENEKFLDTLSPRQEEALKRRIRTFNATIRKKKQKGKKTDIRNFFSNADASSTGTRSRSATPDSLDSVSPPRTPPDPKSWGDLYLSRSRASLDSGNHSLGNTPSSSLLPIASDDSSRRPSYDSQSRKSSENANTPQKDNDRTPSLEFLPLADSHKPLRRHKSYSRDLAKDVKSYYSTSRQGHYELSRKDDDEVPDVQILRYRPIGSIHIPQAHYKEKRRSHESLSSRNWFSEDPPQGSTSDLYKTSLSTSLEDDLDDELWSRTSSGGTDLGFKFSCKNNDEEFPDLRLEIGRSGRTRVDWLDESDVMKLSSLALLELDILFTEYNINHRWRKHKKKKTKEDPGVFGVNLETLIERDQNNLPGPLLEVKVPLVFHKLVNHLFRTGLRDEGILRVPGHRAKTELIKKTLNAHFYSSPGEADAVLRSASANELAALIKQFLRDLPRPLLTSTYMSACYKSHKIPDLGERILALAMLILLLPSANRDTLWLILDLCAQIVAHQAENKMGLYNVAMILAPNLFLPTLRQRLKLSGKNEEQLNNEMEYASETTRLTQVLIKYREALWTVPHRLLAQVRRQYQVEAVKENTTPRFLLRRNKELIQRPIVNEVDYQEGILRVSAPQFSKYNHPVKLNPVMTARDILSKFIEEQTYGGTEKPNRVEGRREQQLKRTASLISSFVVTCLLRGLKHALETHALHERGGNIGERRLDANARLLAVYQDNPNAEFIVKCHHFGGQIDYSSLL